MDGKMKKNIFRDEFSKDWQLSEYGKKNWKDDNDGCDAMP